MQYTENMSIFIEKSANGKANPEDEPIFKSKYLKEKLAKTAVHGDARPIFQNFKETR